MPESLTNLLETKPLGSLLSSFLNAIPGVSRLHAKKQVDDGWAKGLGKFAEEKAYELSQEAWGAGLPLPLALSQLSNERDTLRIGELSTKIAEDKIRQEARTEAQEEIIEQLRVKLAAAFNGKSYEAALILSEMLQQYIIINSDTYSNLDYIRITCLAEIFFSETTADKKREYYKQLSDYVEKYFVICNFSALFNYGLANLHMLSIAERHEKLLFIERAKKSFEKALDFNLDIDFTLNNLAVALKYSERNANTPEERSQILQEAINHLEAAKRVAAQNHKIFSNLGDIYMRLAEISSADVIRQGDFLKLAIQAYSECLVLTRSFPLIMDKANAIFSLGKIEQDTNTKDRLFQDASAFYNDAYIMAPTRTDAAYACLKMAQLCDMGKTLGALPQEQKGRLIFLGLYHYVTALEHAPFYSELQYATAQLILNIAKFGEQDIPLFKENMIPQVATVAPSKRGKLDAAQMKQVRQAIEQAMAQVKINFLILSERYFRDAVYLMPENHQATVMYGEARIYWGFLQKKLNSPANADKELELAAQALDKADELKPYSASYIRACLHAVKGEAKLCEGRLKEAAEKGVCPPRSQVAREPYFLGYARSRWFNDILETLPDRPVGDLYSTTIFSEPGATA